jgi:hypothetical protein
MYASALAFNASSKALSASAKTLWAVLADQTAGSGIVPASQQHSLYGKFKCRSWLLQQHCKQLGHICTRCCLQLLALQLYIGKHSGATAVVALYRSQALNAAPHLLHPC